jgi:hypothetical protein
MFVSPENIEQPVGMKDGCSLLNRFNMYPVLHTEEELADFLEKALHDENTMPICLSSMCGEFYQAFANGETPYSESKPVVLAGYQGKYWVLQGKHRVCVAKRMKVPYIKAFVRELDKDYFSLLPPEEKPGIFRSQYSYVVIDYVVAKKVRNIEGNALLLWIFEEMFANAGVMFLALLDTAKDTKGEWAQALPGVEYSVKVSQEELKSWFWKNAKRITVKAEVKIEADHKKTKIWLLQAPAKEVLRIECIQPEYVTLYRYGRWRKYYEDRLSRNFGRIF